MGLPGFLRGTIVISVSEAVLLLWVLDLEVIVFTTEVRSLETSENACEMMRKD